MKMELSREVLHYSILRFRRIFLNMFLDRRKALRTNIVLDTARILESCLFTDSEVHQPFGEGRVALIDRLGDPAAFVGQCNVSLVIYRIRLLTRRFFIATLTLGFEKPSSVAISIERTYGCFSLNIKIVSR